MRGVLKFLVVAVVVASAGVALLYVVLPGNQAATDGPADPILKLRRPVLRVLRWAGVDHSGAGLFWFDSYLPSGNCSEWSSPGSDGTPHVTARLSRSLEPVYRGLLWRIGDRVTIRMQEFEEPENDVRSLRLGYVRDGEVFTAGESHFGSNTRDRQVTGYVPGDADGWFAVETDAQGNTHSLCSHGGDEMERVLAGS